MPTTLTQKLRILPGTRVLVLHAPEGYLAALVPLPEGVEIATVGEGTYDVVHLFARDQAALDRSLGQALAATKPGGILWISWPKKTGATSDLSRDTLAALVMAHGWGPVASVSVDDIWSALRFKPETNVERGGR